MAGSLRPTWVEVDLGAVAANVRALRARLQPPAALMAVVKADGYGHGAVPVARAALAAGAAWLGVAILEEALQLRAAGIGAPVLVLGWTPPERADELAAADVDQTVFRLEDAAAYAAAGRRAGRPVRLHAKVDTGMGRLGVLAVPDAAAAERAAAAVAEMASLPGVELRGVYTHFAGSDEPDLGGARRQLALFRAVLAGLEARGLRPPLRHAANTGALLRLPESHLDLCRAGIGLYGYLPSPHVPPAGLRPALRWYTRVAHLKRLPAGTGVSYNATYVTPAPETVATLPVGYADGYRRALSGRAQVLLRGRRVPVRGRVCMDQTVVSAEGVPECTPGDRVVLLGEDGGEAIWADELAELAGTIPYEILTGIGPRVPRVYLP